MPTHEVFNTPPPLVGVNAFTSDASLTGAGAVLTDVELKPLTALGELAGSEQAQDWGRLANSNPPLLRTHDRFGHRIDEIEFHPAWHELMGVAVGSGLHGTPWQDSGPNNHLARALKFYVWGQVEAGHGCPISMTYAVVPALRHAPELAAQFEPLLESTTYDFGLRPPLGKAGLLAGMAMTEKQGGSDVRANTTRAEPSDDHYLLTGHKWFCSAPMCDLFLVLAQAPGGLSCFLVPRMLPDGARNTFLIQRLKDKLGNRSNASSEVEFDATHGWLVGAEGAGVRTVIDMVTMTRLDCVIGSSSLQRAALVQALHHARHRSAFGRPLIEQPLMREVLTDLAVESAASTALFVRLARAIDDGESAFVRLAVAAAKLWVCKRTPAFVAEALECLGGNGYVEDSGLPRLFRESPLNGIWEGSGNVIALDVLRAAQRDPQSVAAVLAELDSTAGADERLDSEIAELRRRLAGLGASRIDDERGARGLAFLLARCLAAHLLVSNAPESVAHRYLESWLGSPTLSVYGERPGSGTDAVLDHAT
ncbi:MAG TPA: acyl-CoA dehydrogenase family protein [Jatrophihabitantaceae bacterium]|nr:acyl-CoA dehydrogenase family protein [Jatrophihabitantaceae bacterium]